VASKTSAFALPSVPARSALMLSRTAAISLVSRLAGAAPERTGPETTGWPSL
jgi:hypothetical protein